MPNGKVRFAAIYGNGAVAGFTPQQVRRMSVWQYMAAIDGYIAANTSDEDKTLTRNEEDELAAWLGI